MNFIEPHIHMVSRTTDDYAALADCGCIAVGEPAFWAGFDRRSADAFRDYYDQLTVHEPRRAASFGIRHYAWLCINPKEAEDPAIADAVIDLIPAFLSRPNVLGIGEVGFNRNTRHERAAFERQLDLAASHDTLVLIHTPHLEDKRRGTRLTLELLDDFFRAGRLRPERVLIDHVEEHTLDDVLDAGCWGGLTLYPQTKASPARAADMLARVGGERLWVNSACDWGRADIRAVPKLRRELRRRGHDAAFVQRITLDNPAAFLSQSPNFTADPI